MGKECRFIIEGYDDDVTKDDYHSTIAAFKVASPDVIQNAEEFIFQYYQDINKFGDHLIRNFFLLILQRIFGTRPTWT
jgi:hypothetical protein